MVNKIMVKGFKCFADEEMELKNITLLLGKNSSGKSSVIQSLLILKQEGNNPFRGDYIELGDAKDLTNYIVASEEIKIEANYSRLGEQGEKTAVIRVDEKGELLEKRRLLDLNVVYCPANRIGVETSYEKSPRSDSFLGKNNKYVFSYLATHQRDQCEDAFIYDKDDSLFTFEGQVNYWLKKIVGYRIKAAEIEQIDQDASSTVNNNWVRPQNVGTGITYVAQLIIAAFSCKQGDVLIIENPEIHMHPAGQSDLMDFFAFMAACGVQIIIETHSDHVYNGLRKCVHNNLIGLDDQMIYYFVDDENGCAEPKEVRLREIVNNRGWII